MSSVGYVRALSSHSGIPTCCCAAPTRGRDLIVWDVETGEAKAKVADGWLGFSFNNSSSVLAVWTDQQVSILDPKSGTRLASLGNRDVEYVQFLAQADLVVTQTSGAKGFQRVASELQFWSTKTWERVETKIDRYIATWQSRR